MVNTTYDATQDNIDRLQQLKDKTKLKLYKNVSNYFDNMNTRFNEDRFAKIDQCISKIYQEVLLLMKFSQTEPQVKNMNFNYYDSFYTVIKNKKKEIVDNHYEKDYNNFNDFVPNHYIGRTINNEILM